MAYAAWSVTVGEQPATAKWNIIGTNAADANTRITAIEATAYPPIGSIMPYAGTTAPTNYLLCDGTAVNRVGTYAALFAITSTTYGVGNGTTTFNLPNLKGRVPVGKDTGTFVTLGATGGAETHTLTIAQMPSHNHGIKLLSNRNYTGTGLNPFDPDGADTGDVSLNTGGGGSHNNIQPYQVVNYIIRY